MSVGILALDGILKKSSDMAVKAGRFAAIPANTQLDKPRSNLTL
jgi:hypothetical protein